jgi:predicted PurR-regulated permease PerM
MLPVLSNLSPEGQGRVMSIFSSTFEAGTAVVFVVFSALFLAAMPQLYITMFTKLFAPRLRGDVRETIERVIRTLKYWLLGQFVSMAVVGVITGVALKVAGIPFSLELGILSGLGEFIPFVGPLLVSIPALLLGLSEGVEKFLIVVAILLAVQFFEGNIIVPIVQRKAVDLPPVVTLTSMLLLGSALGLLGLFVAAPLVVVVLVVVEEWYLQRYLGTDDRLLEHGVS